MASGDTIFISSTSADLAEFRKAAIHVAQRLGMRIVHMEDFGPDPRNAVALCEEKVRSADIFLGLYAFRYGFEPAGFGGVSITQMEYEWAAKAGLTILVFMMGDDVPWPPMHVDTGESRAKLDRFRAAIKAEHVIAGLTTPERLREDLFVHLPKFRTERPARASSPVTTIPAPPWPYIAHTYTLLQTEQVIGRAGELAMLDRWAGDASDPLHAARVLCLVAIGGMGKSALTWKWMHDHAPATMTPLAGRMWWSFYETDAGFDQFVIAALAYCTSRSLAAVGQIPRADREAELLAVLNEKPFLLVLDGMERLLIAYAGMDFAHLADDDLDRRSANVVAGALGLPGVDAQAMVSQHRLRKTIDPHVGGFLRKLSRIQASRILITTRLYPSELQTVTGRELPGCAAVFLRGLEPEDALALWRGMGVSGSDEELAELFARFDHYPLLIRALAGEVARFRRAPGDFGAWRRANPGFDPFSLPLVQVKSHVLAHSLSNLEPVAEKLLHTIAAFRSPVDYDTLLALFASDGTSEALDTILSELEDRGLLGWDKVNNRYDLHPIVRGVVWNGLDQSARHGLYDSLRSHFEAVPKPAEPKSLADVRPAIELFNALVGLGRYEAAVNIYYGRVFSADHAFISEGAINQKIAMLESLFPAGLSYPPESEDIDSIYAQLGHAYDSVGRLEEALVCHHRARQTSNDDLFPFLLTMDLRHIAGIELHLGHLRDAVQHVKEAALRKLEKPVQPDPLVIYEAVTGHVDAELLLQMFREGRSHRIDSNIIRITFAEDVHWRVRNIAQTRLSALGERDLADEMELSLVCAQAAIAHGEFIGLSDLLNSVLREAITTKFPRVELDARLLLADLYRRQQELDKAREMLDDVWELARRGGYRLILADAHLVLARLEQDAGNEEAARAAAEEAYRQAYCDGPPYTYHWALIKAEVLIEELGASIPAM